MAEEGFGQSDDNSVIMLTQKKMEELQIFKTETVLLKGKKRKETVAVCHPDNSGKLDDEKFQTFPLRRKERNNPTRLHGLVQEYLKPSLNKEEMMI